MKRKLFALKKNIPTFGPIASWMNIFEVPSTKVVLGILILILAPSTQAHRVANGEINEVDACRVKVGFEWIHFSAYTPETTGGDSYCEAIPDIGPTNLVFDYEGKKLRDVSIEFEVTKEPEGERVFYQEPKKIKTGTVNGMVDFKQHGPGNYLAHVTIVHEGKKLDEHIPFAVGVDNSQMGFSGMLMAIIVLAVILFIMMRLSKKNAVQADTTKQNSE